MFFKNLNTWTDKKLNLARLGFYALYFTCALIIPIIIVALKYDLFKEVSGYRFTAVGIILFLIIAIGGVGRLIRVVHSLPEDKPKQQHLKFTCEMVIALVIPIAILFCLRLLRDNFNLAYSTLTYCVYCWLVAIVIDYMILKYLDAEHALRKEANHVQAVNERVNRNSAGE